MIWLVLSATTMAATAIYHSYAGEKGIVRPLLSLDAPLMARPAMRQAVRVGWHMGSYFMAVCAVVVLWPDTPGGLIIAIGATWVAIGFYIFSMRRGRHRGSLMLMAAGILAIVGVLA
jgi:hypothetical protein